MRLAHIRIKGNKYRRRKLAISTRQLELFWACQPEGGLRKLENSEEETRRMKNKLDIEAQKISTSFLLAIYISSNIIQAK